MNTPKLLPSLPPERCFPEAAVEFSRARPIFRFHLQIKLLLQALHGLLQAPRCLLHARGVRPLRQHDGRAEPELQPLERLIVPRAVDGDDRHSGLQGQQRRALLEGQERFRRVERPLREDGDAPARAQAAQRLMEEAQVRARGPVDRDAAQRAHGKAAHAREHLTRRHDGNASAAAQQAQHRGIHPPAVIQHEQRRTGGHAAARDGLDELLFRALRVTDVQRQQLDAAAQHGGDGRDGLGLVLLDADGGALRLQDCRTTRRPPTTRSGVSRIRRSSDVM